MLMITLLMNTEDHLLMTTEDAAECSDEWMSGDGDNHGDEEEYWLHKRPGVRNFLSILHAWNPHNCTE